ncbi:hypothetical protein NA78x_005768 [Anatilimnocola sp. NA78]|uniref:DUF7919 family protein n=1 Tax=Anatilimnocola sp. NA78 TaxID=3415683 RepID=UPI003CE54F53
MAGFPDLSPWAYLPNLPEHILAVGWLDRLMEFPRGATSPEVFERLQWLARDPWQPIAFAGSHECELCQFHGEKGTANLYLPHQGKIYVCPELIIHYINAHYYSPPSIFYEAVLACPAMNTIEYKRSLIACQGQVLWKSSVNTI